MSVRQAGDYQSGLNGAMARELRGERAAQGLTIEQLAERSGLPVVTVQRLLSARRALTLETFDKLCDGLGMDNMEMLARANKRVTKADPDLVERVVRGIRSGRKR